MASRIAAMDMRTALKNKGEADWSAALLRTKVAPQIRVINTRRMWALSDRGKISVAYNIFESNGGKRKSLAIYGFRFAIYDLSLGCHATRFSKSQNFTDPIPHALFSSAFLTSVSVDLGNSKTHSSAFLSRRRPSKTGARILISPLSPSCVHSVNLISATSSSSSQ